MLNTTESENYKKSQHIDSLRKQRAVFDQIFKGIEVNIEKEEKKMVQKIKSLRKKEKLFEKTKKDYDKLMDIIGKNHRDKLVEEIGEVYKKNYLEYSGSEEDSHFMDKISSEINQKKTLKTNELTDPKNILSIEMKRKSKKKFNLI